MLFSRKPRLAQWRQRRTKDGYILEIKPAPVVKDITFDIFERGCLLLGIDPDELLTGEFDTRDLPEPPLAKTKEFLSLVLTKPELYDVGSWEPDKARYFVSMVAVSFMVGSFVNLRKPAVIQATSSNEPGMFSVFQPQKVTDLSLSGSK